MSNRKPPITMDSLMLTRKRMKKIQSKSKVIQDSIPLTLNNLSQFLDWRYTLPQAPTLYKIASIIWLYLPPSSVQHYSINFDHSNEIKPYQSEEDTSPPVLVTSSPKGDLLVMVQSVRKSEEMYSEPIFLLILYPSYISNCKYFDPSTIKLDTGIHCTYWEIDNIEHLTHLAMDKYGLIYFTDGEVIYRISKTTHNMYTDNFETIYTSQNDTSHITCLWRQHNDIYFSLQNWDNEENIDIYKLRPVKNKGIINMNDKPQFVSNHSNSSNSSNHSSDSENETNNEYFKKLRAFSLQYNKRIWQLGSLRYEKKMLIAVGAAVMGNTPNILQIGFHTNIKVLKMANSADIIWPKTLSDKVPHGIYHHKESKSWFCIVPTVNNKESKKDNKMYWIQFKFSKDKKKITWQRMILIPCIDSGEWLYYDEIRDVLIGYKHIDMNKNEYIFKYLCDISKYLCIETHNGLFETVPTMHRAEMYKIKKGHKESPKLQLNKSKKNVDTFSLSGKKKKKKKTKDKVDNSHILKPSFAKNKSNKKEMGKVNEEDVMD